MAKMLFIQREGRELMGVMSIAAYSNKNHEYKVVIDNNQDNVTAALMQYRPDVVGIPLMSKDHFWGVDTAQMVKDRLPNSLVLLGGPHPTCYHKILLEPGVDAICIGEGEKPVKTLLDRIDEKKPVHDVNSLWIKRNGTTYKNPLEPALNAEEIPIPSREMYMGVDGVSEDSDLVVMCSRGCPFKCSFCINYSLGEVYRSKGSKLPPLRFRRPEDIITEIYKAKQIRPITTISFQDDMFGVNPQWLSKFKSVYEKEVGLPFYSLLRFDAISPEFIKTLLEMGCFEVGLGLETGNANLRNMVLGKKLDDQEIVNGAEMLHKAGMSFHTFNMFGLPEETLQNSYETIDLNFRLNPAMAYTQIFHPYPGSRFFDQGGEEIERAVISRDFNKFRINYPFTPDWKAIERVQKLAMAVVHHPPLRGLLHFMVTAHEDDPRFFDALDQFAQQNWAEIYKRRLTSGK